MKKRNLTLLFILLLTSLSSLEAFSQCGRLTGTITDKETKEKLSFANVVVQTKEGVAAGQTTTDFDGKYTIKCLQPGKYEILTSSVGYYPFNLKYIEIFPDSVLVKDIEMLMSKKPLPEVEVILYK